MFMYKTVICVVYVDDCLFWERSQSEIDNVMKYFKEDGPSYNWEHSDGDSVSELLRIVIRLRHLVGHIIMVMRLREIVPTHMILL